MLALMTSPDAMLKQGAPDQLIADVFKATRAAGYPVGLISNGGKPDWFDGLFAATDVQFLQARGRQSGDIVVTNAQQMKINTFDVVVLASKPEDVQMGKNGRALLVAAGWSDSPQVTRLGIKVNDAAELREVLNLTSQWSGQWWFTAQGSYYHIRALSDLSGYGKSISQQQFASRLTKTVKNGGSRLNALLAVTARSLLMDGTDQIKDLVWGVYPSSHSANDDTDVLCDFTHRLRTTISRVHHAQRDTPLFIRHTPSVKRSRSSGSVDRTDPTGQIVSLHLNPFYRGRISGKHVIVIDDCTTYGVSFGVAAAFLKKAGATSITGIALGKFGNQLRNYDIELCSDPYAPVAVGAFRIHHNMAFVGTTNPVSQQALNALISGLE